MLPQNPTRTHHRLTPHHHHPLQLYVAKRDNAKNIFKQYLDANGGELKVWRKLSYRAAGQANPVLPLAHHIHGCFGHEPRGRQLEHPVGSPRLLL